MSCAKEWEIEQFTQTLDKEMPRGWVNFACAHWDGARARLGQPLCCRGSLFGDMVPGLLLGPSQNNVGDTIRIRKLSTQRTGEDNYWLFSTRHTKRWGNHTQAYLINMSGSHEEASGMSQVREAKKQGNLPKFTELRTCT